MKNIVVLSTSLRSNSNSAKLAEAFANGAEAAGHAVERISLKDKEMHFCIGCLACQKTGKCVLTDDVQAITEKVRDADIVVFATPIYYYEMSGQMKTLIDRMNALYTADYRFRSVYLLATAAEDEESAVDGAVNGLQGWIACFPKAELSGVVRAVGVSEAGEIASREDLLEQAYDMGRNIA
ncbi:MAG: flavodoxin family protein [Clostridiales bacterium]|nr:flavodoxin family protein [Clostridiales bacterium]